MDLALLRPFVTVHRAGSFTRAAALLGLSQPAPHLDALVEIAEAGGGTESAVRTLHLAGPPEFTALRALPALVPLMSQGLAVRSTFLAQAEDALDGLAAGHHDLALTTARPRGGLLASTPLCDEEHVLVATPRWAGRLGPGALRHWGSVVLEQLPVVEVHESLPLVSRYWAAVFDSPPAASAAVIAPDLRAVLECAVAGAGLAVLPRYLCQDALERGEVVVLLDPPIPPLRTYFLVVRIGTLSLPHIARAHEWLVRAAVDW